MKDHFDVNDKNNDRNENAFSVLLCSSLQISRFPVQTDKDLK